jgi:enamine deaminase RidA (YjgF/YER057c/UK114 family)
VDTINPEGWPRPRGFSNGTVAAGRIVKVAGQIGRDPVTDALAEGFGGQAAQALANVVDVVKAAGGTAADIASLTWYVTDLKAYMAAGREIGGAYKELIGRHFPAMTMVQVVALLDDEAQVEIEATAVLA